MTAHVYPLSTWWQARNRRASAGKGPLLAVRRSIIMHQMSDASWSVAISEWRFGTWKEPEWRCARVSFDAARHATMQAWKLYRLPVLWRYSTDTRLRPFLVGWHEPKADVA